MRVVLVDDVLQLGRRGQIVNVSTGYGRNYLIPKGFAVPATAANLKMVEQQRAALARKEAQAKADAEILAQELVKLHLVVSRKAGDTGALFGSVTSKDLSELLELKGFHIDRRKIVLEHPLKTIGNFDVQTRPHPEVPVSLAVSVIPEDEEPVQQIVQRGSNESESFLNEVERVLRQAHVDLEVQKDALHDSEDSVETPTDEAADHPQMADEDDSDND